MFASVNLTFSMLDSVPFIKQTFSGDIIICYFSCSSFVLSSFFPFLFFCFCHRNFHPVIFHTSFINPLESVWSVQRKDLESQKAIIGIVSARVDRKCGWKEIFYYQISLPRPPSTTTWSARKEQFMKHRGEQLLRQVKNGPWSWNEKYFPQSLPFFLWMSYQRPAPTDVSVAKENGNYFSSIMLIYPHCDTSSWVYFFVVAFSWRAWSRIRVMCSISGRIDNEITCRWGFYNKLPDI